MNVGIGTEAREIPVRKAVSSQLNIATGIQSEWVNCADSAAFYLTLTLCLVTIEGSPTNCLASIDSKNMNPRILSPLFALLIFVAHIHCVLEHRVIDAPSPNAVAASVATAGLSDFDSNLSPLATSLPAENEDHDHCEFCNGVTLVDFFELSDSSELNPLSDFESLWFAAERSTLELCTLHSWRQQRTPARYDFRAIPARPADRCALLQSFLI